MKIALKDQMSFDSFGFRRKLYVVIGEISPGVVIAPPPPNTHLMLYIVLCFNISDFIINLSQMIQFCFVNLIYSFLKINWHNPIIGANEL